VSEQPKAQSPLWGIIIGGVVTAGALLLVSRQEPAPAPAPVAAAPVAPTRVFTPQPDPDLEPEQEPEDPGLLPTGSVAPDFTLEKLSGGTLKLSALRGKVVLIDFWATWCPPCRRELPTLVKLVHEYEARGVSFVAISEDDPPGQRPDVTAFARQTPGFAPYVVLGDPAVESRFLVENLPTLYVLKRDGTVLGALVGAAQEADLRQAIEAGLSAH
jgi:thiol-disulfide isomerase/thioredoxin